MAIFSAKKRSNKLLNKIIVTPKNLNLYEAIYKNSFIALLYIFN